MAFALMNAGKAIAAARMIGATPSQAEPKYVAWGTGGGAGTGTPAATDTTLTTASAEARVAGTSSQVTTSVTNDTYRVTATITSLSVQSISEVAMFDAATAGNIFLKGYFTPYSLNTNDSILFSLSWQVS